MKRIVTIVIATLASFFTASSQCTPDNNLSTPGIYPASSLLDCVERGVPYSQDIQFVIPSNLGGFITITSITVNSVNGLPSGLSYSCNPANCVFPGGSTSCLRLSGTTVDPLGTYPVKFTVTVASSVGPFSGDLDSLLGVSGLFPPPNYELKVINVGDPCGNPLAVTISGNTDICPGDATILTADVVNNVGITTYLWSTGENTTSISVTLAGAYSVTVTDQNTSATATATVTVGGHACDIGCSALPSPVASSCVPQQLSVPGFSDSTGCMELGQVANITIFFHSVNDTSTFEYFKIDSLTNLPCGLAFALNDTSRTYPAGEDGCLTITGTTSSPAGDYKLGIWVSVKLNVLPNPLSGEAGNFVPFGFTGFTYTLTVNNPGTSCQGVSNVSVSGVIATESGKLVNTATVSATGTSAPTDITDATGSYSLSFTAGETTTVTPSKSNDVSTNNGVTTLDILLTRQHILNIALLNTPYKVIAADANQNGSVTTLDILLIRSVILQINSSFNGKLWAFAPSDYVFADPQNPYPFPSSRTYNNLAADQANQDFTAIKLGDVNNSWDPNVAKTEAVGEVGFAIDEIDAMPGQEVIVPVKTKDFKNVTGYQFTLSWNPEVLEFSDVIDQSLEGHYGTIKSDKGFLTTSWNDDMTTDITLNDDAVVFEVKFKVKGEKGTSSEIKIGSEMTRSEAYNENFDLLEIKSSSGIVKVGDVSAPNTQHSTPNTLRLSVQPNPFSNTTQITFNLPQDEQVTLSIYDILGKEVKQAKGEFKAGRNQIEWSGDDRYGKSLNNGLYQVRINTENNSTSAKIILSR